MNRLKTVYRPTEVDSRRKWDLRFLKLCLHISDWSEDRRTRIGAVIVGEANVVVATGYNGLPRGIESEVARRHNRESEEKYFWFEHAERNAIYNAARLGIKLSGCRMYVSLSPCADCARAVIQSGIAEVIILKNGEALSDSYSSSISVAEEMFNEARVKVLTYDTKELTHPSSER